MRVNVARMERDGESSHSEFDYSWVDSVVMDVVSFYQTDAQLEEITWGFPGTW